MEVVVECLWALNVYIIICVAKLDINKPQTSIHVAHWTMVDHIHIIYFSIELA